MTNVRLDDIFQFISSQKRRFIDELEVLVRKPSMSQTGEGIEACVSVLQSQMQASGIETRILPTAGYPVLYGEVKDAERGPTVVIYGHYDVKQPESLDAWISPPFEPVIRDGRMYGRGVGDDKGQIYAHVKAVESILSVRRQLPVNVKLLFEGEEEIASPHLKAFIQNNRDLLKADLMYSSDGTQYVGDKAAIYFGVRGILKIEISARGPSCDVHSGNYGGVMPNPVWTLIHLLKTMKDEDGRVLIEGFYDDVLSPTSRERRVLAEIGFDEHAFCREWGLKAIDRGMGKNPLERLMFWPTFNIQSFIAGTAEVEGINIIPSKAKVTIDIRLVPNQKPEDIWQKIQNHCNAMGHVGEFNLTLKTQTPPFRSSFDHPYTVAVIEAVTYGFEERPLLIPSMGGSDPTYIFSTILGLPCFKVPYQQYSGSNCHAPNESLSLDVYIKGIRTTAALIQLLAEYGPAR